jgi:crossover junction endodeoxyribonuclease RusA
VRSTDFEVPWPPSTNHYWRSLGRGRTILSEDGRKFRDAVEQMCGFGQVRPFGSARLSVTMVAHPPDNRRRDLDNLFKALLDGLAHAGVYEDDSQIDDLRITRGQIAKVHPCVIVKISEMEERNGQQ